MSEKKSIFDELTNLKIVGVKVNFKDSNDNSQVDHFKKLMEENGHIVTDFGLTQIDGGSHESDNVYGFQINVKFKRSIKFSEINARKVVKMLSGFKFYGSPRITYIEYKKGSDEYYFHDVSAFTVKDLKENMEYIMMQAKKSSCWRY
jgi:hypothetical protein